MTARVSDAGMGAAVRTSMRHTIWSIMLYTSPLLLAVAVYGYAVTLPFFLDDGPHFQILAQTDGLRHWGDFDPFPFYRPFTFSVWKLFEPAGYPAPVMHWLNVLCFGAGGVLVGQLTRRLAVGQLRMAAAVFAGWTFVLFPFSYQAVVMVAALFHLTLVLGLLVSLWAALMWLDGRGGTGLLVICWLAAFAGVFSHENGILLFPLLLLVLVAAYRHARPPLPRLALVAIPLLLIVVVYGLLWLGFSPHDDTGLSTDLAAGLAVLLQGLIYPFAAALRPFVDGDIRPELLLALVGFITLVILAFTWWYLPQHLPGALMGLAWYGLAVLPAAVALPAGYVLGQPRLALMASVGGSVFWGLALTAVFQRRRGLIVLPLLAFLFISVPFLWMRRVDFVHLRDWNRQAVALLDAHNAAATGAVLVNAPDYITPGASGRMFVLGTEGALFVDETLDYNQQFWMNSETDYRAIDVYAVPAIQRNTGFNYRAHPPIVGDPANFAPLHRAPLLFVTQFDGSRFYPRLVGGTALDADTGNDTIAAFDDGAFSLLDAAATLNTTTNTIEAQLVWHVDDPADVKLFLHITCDGVLIAQADGYPWGDLYPFSMWQPGDSHVDIRTIQLNENVSQDCLHVYTGLYTVQNVTRLAAVNPETETRLPDDAIPVPLEVVDSQ